MEYVYAAMLLHKAGKEINDKNLADVLTAAGINVDPVKIKALVASLAEVNIDEAIKTPALLSAAPAPTAPAPASEEKPAKEKKKEEEDKAKEEAALEGLGALFG